MVTLTLGNGTEIQLQDSESILTRVCDRALAKDMGGPEHPVSAGEIPKMLDAGRFVRVMEGPYWRIVHSAKVS